MHAHSRQFFQRIHIPKPIPALIQGIIIGIILVILEISFASVIFSGPLTDFAAGAAGMFIFGASALSLTTGLFSSFPCLISRPQDTPAAILAVASASIMAALPTASSTVMFATVCATLIASALITGVFFLLIGTLGLSNFARFLPYPVMGGFMAGGGTMLVLSSFGVMADTTLTWSSLPQFLTMDMFFHWGPGLAFGLTLYIMMRLRPHFLIIPGGMFAGISIFFLTITLLDVSIPQAQAQGWLLVSMPTGHLWPVFTPATASNIDWATFMTQIPNIFTVALLSLVAMTLNVNGIELGSRKDIDMDRELCVEAVGNILGGIGGSFAGYSTLSLSMLGPRSKIISRIIPITAAMVGIVVLCFGAQAFIFIPKPLLGGLLMVLGLFFVEEWIISGWKRLTLPDYIIVLVIVLAIVNQGFLAGVGLGLGLTIIIFIARFTRIPAIRTQTTLTNLHSTRHRSIPDRILLSRSGDTCVILNLAGYLFFGSAYFIGQNVKKLFELDAHPQRLILDFSKIQGFDISAVNTFQRIAQQAHTKGISISLAAAPSHLINLLKRNTMPEIMHQVIIFNDLDSALEAAENIILREHCKILNNTSSAGIKAREKLFHEAADDLDAYLEKQMRFEKLLEYMQADLKQQTIQQGETLVWQGKEHHNVFFVIQGGISVFRTDNNGKQNRIGTLGPGKIIAPQAAWGPWKATYTARAEYQAYVAVLSGKNIRDLEQKTPETAMHLYRYMAKILAEENRTR